jgi:hypothetical protein
VVLEVDMAAEVARHTDAADLMATALLEEVVTEADTVEAEEGPRTALTRA